MENKPLVSVYITTRNRHILLDRAIQSVLTQTWGNLELIVCDDASSDDTSRLLQKYSDELPNFYWIRNDTMAGACVSRNNAINKATGEFITGLDDDDYFLPQRIELLMEAYKDEYAFVCSTYYRKTHERTTIVKDGVGVIGLNDVLHYNKIGNQVLTKTQRLKDVGGFDVLLPSFQDYDVWVRLLKKFGKSLKIKKPLYVFDISHTNERISGSNDRVQRGYEIFVKKHQAIMNKKHIQSMRLLEQVIKNRPMKLSDAIRFCNTGNYKSVISNLLKSNE
tara:strand:+ start:185 stop:1018 length:834 start_codon:yes stop_codon:yes gene_type:complete